MEAISRDNFSPCLWAQGRAEKGDKNGGRKEEVKKRRPGKEEQQSEIRGHEKGQI
jgi:hypothetical protein